MRHNLYAVNACLRHMLYVWQTTYTKIFFINIDELLTYGITFELGDFIVMDIQNAFVFRLFSDCFRTFFRLFFDFFPTNN